MANLSGQGTHDWLVTAWSQAGITLCSFNTEEKYFLRGVILHMMSQKSYLLLLLTAITIIWKNSVIKHGRSKEAGKDMVLSPSL